jgi:hypothetical protein
MKANIRFLMMLAGSMALCGSCVVGAQGLGALKGMAGGGNLSSVAAGSTGNAAGIVEFCVKNNYLGGDASSVRDQLAAKMGGADESAKDKVDYSAGKAGMLTTGDGQKIDLAKMGGMKKSMTKKVCSSVLDHAKSFL